MSWPISFFFFFRVVSTVFDNKCILTRMCRSETGQICLRMQFCASFHIGTSMCGNLTLLATDTSPSLALPCLSHCSALSSPQPPMLSCRKEKNRISTQVHHKLCTWILCSADAALDITGLCWVESYFVMAYVVKNMAGCCCFFNIMGSLPDLVRCNLMVWISVPLGISMRLNKNLKWPFGI